MNFIYKWPMAIFLFLSGFLVKAQFSGVIDAFAISDKFYLHNTMPLKFYNGLYMHSYIFQGQDSESAKKYYIDDFGVPFDLLMNEDKDWVIRAWYSVDLNSENNKVLNEYYRYQFKDEEDSTHPTGSRYVSAVMDSVFLMHRICEELQLDNLTLYLDSCFYKVADKSYIDSIDPEYINFLELKVDWNYDQEKGRLIPYTICLALMSNQNNKIKTIGYIYYPQLRWILNGMWYYENEIYESFHQYFDNRRYTATCTKKFKLYDNTLQEKIHHGDQFYWQNRTELEALLEIEILKDQVRYTPSNLQNGKINFKTRENLEINGAMENGWMDGNWQIKDFNGHPILVAHFENGFAHGEYKSYWNNGKLKESGLFQFGKKEGNWKSFSEEGILIADRNYAGGWTEGSQELFYANGNSQIKYQYKNHLLNGTYIYFDEKGNAALKGEMKDGFKAGIWEHNIYVNDEFIRLNALVPDTNGLRLSDEVLRDNLISFKVEYKQYSEPLLEPYGFRTDMKYIGDFE